MNKIKTLSCLGFAAWFGPAALFAGGAGTSGALNLLSDPNARAASLAGALAAEADDIGAFSYNPASLSTLRTGQVSLLYGQGLTDDALSHAAAGFPMRRGALGVSFLHYDGGDFDFFDGVARRTVTAQTDLALAVGYGLKEGRFDWGVAAKYFRSELIERSEASAVAFDFGAAAAVSSRLRVGASFQNVGSELKYEGEGDDLPRLARLSAAFDLSGGSRRGRLFVDLPYYMNESALDAGVGLEGTFGPLSLRAGYRTGVDQGGFAAGAGFALGRAAIDYSFGLIDDLDNTQKVSVTFRFGAAEKRRVLNASDLRRARAMTLGETR